MKFGLCAHFAFGRDTYDGQTIKSKTFYSTLCKAVGKDDVAFLDTSGWRRNPFGLLAGMVRMCAGCDRIVIMPEQHGIYVILPLAVLLKSLFGKRLYYVVVGGWLPDFLGRHRVLRYLVKKTEGIFVEAERMKQKLELLRVRNAVVLPNFKETPVLSERDLHWDSAAPFKACTFSRVMREKGIELAMEAVSALNEKAGGTVFTLDIWGMVDPPYEARFRELMEAAPAFVRYRGIASPQNTCAVLKDYTVLLFPTFYECEGFAGTILDAFAAGLPVVASDWNYNSEIVNPGVCGFLCRPNDAGALMDKLALIAEQFNAVIPQMKRNCLAEARNYLPEKVMADFLKSVQA